MNKVFIIFCALAFNINVLDAQFSVVNLKTDYEQSPLSIDNITPQFSWQMQSDDKKRNRTQSAFQIEIKDDKGTSIWNSQKINKDQSHGIKYMGSALKPKTRYTWQVTVWDNYKYKSQEKSWFETGLLNNTELAWSGAQWIGGGSNALALYSDYLSMYKISYDIKFPKGSTKASFIFGANDPRLANPYLNFMAVKKQKNESYIEVELDVSPLALGKNAMLNIYRVGYTVQDKADVPFKAVIIPTTLINESNQNEMHSIYINCNFGIFNFYVNGEGDKHILKDPAFEVPNPWAVKGLNLNPVGRGNDYISFPMLAEIGFKTLKNQKASFKNLHIKNYRSPSNDLFFENLLEDDQSIFSSDKVRINDASYQLQDDAFVTASPNRNAAPMLRSEFDIDKVPIAKARLYITARGVYEVYLNGNRISEDYFNPGLTQYNKHHTYQTYDVTESISTGKNCIGAWLSEGWWSGNATYSGDNWNYFGDRQSLLAMLEIAYTDGTKKTIVTNEKDWKVYLNGPIRYSSFFQGEAYDATKEASITGWANAGYDDKKWEKAHKIDLEQTTFENKNILNFDNYQLIAQQGSNARIVKTLTALNVKEVRPNVYVYDMGQNLVGIPEIKINSGVKGQVIRMRYAEVTYPDLPAYKGNEGMIMMENIRAALATDTYILKGGDEIIKPRFTFHGYRFVEITGIDQPLPIDHVKAHVISSIDKITATYETSEPLVNKLWENITWSFRGNFLSIPTDCPNRNERMGWSGDISVFARSACYLSNVNNFLNRHLIAMRDIQSPAGRFTDVAPLGGGFGGTLWGSAGITVAWETYKQYGDIQLLSDHYESMKKYIAFLDSKVEKPSGILNEGPLGDWLSPEGNKNDNTLFWMAYYAYDCTIVSKAAHKLGKIEESRYYENKSNAIKTVFNQVYIDSKSHVTVKSGVKTGFMGPPNEQDLRSPSDKGKIIDTQASYAIPLALDVFDHINTPYALSNMVKTIERKNLDDGGVERPSYALMTGFIGTAAISEALSDHQRIDLAYKLLTNKEYPSWLYSVRNGATTIWERLNSYTIDNGFGGNNSMNSFNHYSFGAVAAWMQNQSLGIQSDEANPGFKTFVLQPTADPTGYLTYAQGYYESNYGKIESKWKIVGNKTIYNLTVPANTKASLKIKAWDKSMIKESGKSIKKWKDVRSENGFILLNIGSGSYEFSVQ